MRRSRKSSGPAEAKESAPLTDSQLISNPQSSKDQAELESRRKGAGLTVNHSNHLRLHADYGNAAVTEALVQRKPEGQGIAGTPATQTRPRASDAATTPAPALIVDDYAKTLEPGQMRKSDFLFLLRASISKATAEELANTQWSEEGCPYIEGWFAFYGRQTGSHIEQALHRYAPEALNQASANTYLEIVTGRVRQAVKVWAETGQVTGEPGAAGLSNSTGGLKAAVGGAVSAMSRMFRKRREGATAAVEGTQVDTDLGGGESLDGEIKSRMEQAFGESFTGVKIHRDAKAAEAASDEQARALTVGKHIAFAEGEYKPGTPVGDALIAHELAHVLQQRGGGSSAAQAPKEAMGDMSLEQDADQSAIDAVTSVWGRTRLNIGRISRNAMPQLKSGLRLQACKIKTTDDEKKKVDEALQTVTKDNPELEKAFKDYYADHDFYKMKPDEAAAAAKVGLYAETSPSSDTYLRPDVVAPDFSNTKLGLLLIHEFVHTRHMQNSMGLASFQEGDAYGIEYFLAERAGHSERVKEILTVMGSPLKLVIADQVTELKLRFAVSYSTMKALYEIIDAGKSPHAGSPLETVTPEEAKKLVAELVATKEADRSLKLKDIIVWIKGNLSIFKSPI